MIRLGPNNSIYSDVEDQTLAGYGLRWQQGAYRSNFSIPVLERLLKAGYEVDKEALNYYNKEKMNIFPKRYFSSAGLKLPLLPFQEEGRDFILKTGSCILADQMGLGKTPTALAACEFWGCKTLILTRAALIDQWGSEIEKFTDSSYTLIQSGRDRESAWKRAIHLPDHYVVASYDIMRSKSDLKYAYEYIKDDSTVIYDEITMLKNASAKRSRAISLLKPRASIGLTGTPYENHLREYYQIFNLVRPDLLPPYYIFEKMFMIVNERKIKTKNNRIITIKEVVKEINLDTLRKMLEPGMLRRERAIIEGLPKTSNIVHKAPMNKLQREIEGVIMDLAYDSPELRLSCFTFGLENAISPAMIMPFINEYAAHLQEKAQSISPRLEEVGSIIDEAAGLKIVIYSRYVKALGLIEKHVLNPRGITPAYLTGQRDDIEEFKNSRSILLMSGAGAYGLNLQDQAHLMILVDKPFNPAVLEQVKARIDRLGQKFPVQYHEFSTDSEIERRAYEIIGRKNITSSKLLAQEVFNEKHNSRGYAKGGPAQNGS